MFAVLSAARELRLKEQAEFFRNMINVAFVPSGDKDYISSLHKYWAKRQDMAIPEFAPEQVEYKSDGTPVLPMEVATKLMIAQMRAFKRINGGG